MSEPGSGIRFKTGSVRFLAPFKRHGQQLQRHRSRRNLWAWFGAASTALASLAAYPLIQSSLKPGPSVAVDRVDSSSQSDPTSFSPEELQELQRRFGVHGPQPPLARLFTKGVDQFTPLRNHTVTRLHSLQPVIQQQSRRTGLNPMLLAAILFDEMQHAKPGKFNDCGRYLGDLYVKAVDTTEEKSQSTHPDSTNRTGTSTGITSGTSNTGGGNVNRYAY